MDPMETNLLEIVFVILYQKKVKQSDFLVYFLEYQQDSRNGILQWTTPVSLEQLFVLWEIIAAWLGEEYINFADDDNAFQRDRNGLISQDIKDKIKTIDEFLWMNFSEYTMVNGKEYLFANYWIHWGSYRVPNLSKEEFWTYAFIYPTYWKNMTSFKGWVLSSIIGTTIRGNNRQLIWFRSSL